MPLGLFSGAGLLAGGVKAIFSGEARQRRQDRRAERRGQRAERRAEDVSTAVKDISTVVGDVPPTGPPTPPNGEKFDIDEFVKKNWIILAVGAAVLFGGKLLKPKRRAPRRRPAAKVVTRYRTRKPATRRRRR